MIDFKYHLLTITAIFLSLTVGIVIGMAIPGTELFSQQQQTALADLESSFSRLKVQTSQQEEQISKLALQLRTAEEFGQLVYPLLVKDRLAQVKVGVITGPEGGSGQVLEALSVAGAQLSWEIQIDQAETVPLLVSALSKHSETNDIVFDIKMSAERIEPVDKVILWGPFSNEFMPNLRTLEQALLKTNALVIGVQAWNDGESRPFFMDLPISGVDNVDTPTGLVSLIALLQGEKGHYGNSASADILPGVVKEWASLTTDQFHRLQP